jgi:hypothetical protein
MRAEYRQRPEILGLGYELPLQKRPNLPARFVDPRFDYFTQLLNFFPEAESADYGFSSCL